VRPRLAAALLAGVLLGALGAALPSAPTAAQTPAPAPVVDGVDCARPPIGALPPARPLWCDLPLPQPGGSTARQAENAWADDFQHGLSLSGMAGTGYRLFQNEALEQTAENAGRKVHPSLHFRHQDHWMADVHHATSVGGERNGYGGAYLRPDRAFRFDAEGRLVVEFDFAAGVLEYGGTNWGEVIVTTGPAPDNATHGFTLTDTDGFSNFRGHWTFGTKLKPSRDFNDSFLINDDTSPDTLKRPSFERHLYERVGGGGPWTPETDAAFRLCRGTDPDTDCRDRFRIAFDAGADTITWTVNGVRYHQAHVEKGLPAGLTDAPGLYVYFVSWVYRNSEGPNVTRFHWDRVAVNPHLLGDGPAPPTATATATATPAPTLTPAPPTATSTPAPTPTAVPTGTATPVPPAASPAPTSTPAPAACEALVRSGGVERWVRKPPAFCQDQEA
jgi:hypothetical protein